MHLLAPPGTPFANLKVIRDTLEKYPTDAVVKFELRPRSGELVWRDVDTDEAVSISRVSVPLTWLDDVQKAPKVELVTRFLATDVLATVNCREVVTRRL